MLKDRSKARPLQSVWVQLFGQYYDGILQLLYAEPYHYKKFLFHTFPSFFLVT